MRNCLLFSALGLFTVFSGLTSCSSSPSENTAKSDIQVKQVNPEPETTENSSVKSTRFAPTTRYPEPANKWSSVYAFQTPADERETDTEKLKLLLARYEPKTELFRIDPKAENLLTTENGTKIAFLDSAFLDDRGNLIVDSITIRVKVYNDQLAFLAGNLTTQTTDDQLLETGGMLDLRAIFEQKELQLNPGKPAVISFPVSGPKLDGMQTFYGSQSPEGTTKWNVADLKSAAPEKFHLRVYQFTGGLNEVGVDWILEDTDESLLDWLEDQDIGGSELEAFLSKPGHQIQTKMEVDQKGKLILTRLNNNDDGALIYELQSLFDKAPRLNRESMSAYVGQVEYFISFTGTFKQSADKIRSRVVRKYGKFKNEILDNPEVEELNNYVLEINQLGTINCDKFSDKKQTGEVLVKSESPDKVIKTLLVFDKFRSQAEGRQTEKGWQFSNLPLNTHARIIAFSSDGKQIFMANQKVQVKNGEFIMPEFHPFTYKELELAFRF